MQVRFFLISAVVCGQVGAATLHFNNTTGGTDYGFELDDQALTIKFDPVTLGGTPYDSGILQQTVTGFVGFTPVNIIQTVRVHGVLPVLQVDSLGPFQMTVGSPYWDISGTQSDAFRAELPEMISLQADWTMSGPTESLTGSGLINLDLYSAIWFSSADLRSYPTAVDLIIPSGGAPYIFYGAANPSIFYTGTVDGINVSLGATAYVSRIDDSPLTVNATIPIPFAAWLFGGALLSLSAIQRRLATARSV